MPRPPLVWSMGVVRRPQPADWTSDPKSPFYIEPRVKERQNRIREEIAGLAAAGLPKDHWAHKWAGSYSTGGGFGGSYLHIAPKAGVVEGGWGCMEASAWGGEIVEELPDGLWVSFTEGPLAGAQKRYTFVRWDCSWFALDQRGDMESLLEMYARGGHLFLTFSPRRDTVQAHASARHEHPSLLGRPDLPAAYARRLREGPSILRVSKVLGMSVRRQPNYRWAEVNMKVELQGDVDAVAHTGWGTTAIVRGVIQSGECGARVDVDRSHGPTNVGTLRITIDRDAPEPVIKVGQFMILVQGGAMNNRGALYK